MLDIEYAQKIISVVTRMGIFCVHGQHMDVDINVFEACRCSFAMLFFLRENPVRSARLTKNLIQIASIRNFAKPSYCVDSRWIHDYMAASGMYWCLSHTRPYKYALPCCHCDKPVTREPNFVFEHGYITGGGPCTSFVCPHYSRQIQRFGGDGNAYLR